MLVVVAIGILITASGLALLTNLFGAADLVIRRVTSQSLGTLAPGFAASRHGFSVYAIVLTSLGALVLGLGLIPLLFGIAGGIMVMGAITFVIASVIAIRGEVETYRAINR